MGRVPMTKKRDRIEEREGKFCAVSADGSRSFGCFDTRPEANERLRQVEAAKAAKSDADFDRLLWSDVPVTDFTPQDYSQALNPKGDSVFRIDKIGPIHFDKDRNDGFLAEITPEGFLLCDGRMTRTGVLQYSDGEGNEWGEFLDESEVFDADSLASFQMLVITDDHPATMVSADNVHDVQVGHTGSDARRDGAFMRASLLITDKNVIRSIQDGKVELSLGYFAQVIQDAGVAPDGTPFTHRQTNRRGNHLALVDEGRAGPECRAMFDSGGAFTPEEIFAMPKKAQDKKKKREVIRSLIKDGRIVVEGGKVEIKDDKLEIKDAKILVAGEEFEVDDIVAEAFNQMSEKMEEMAAELSRLKEPAAEDAEHPEDLNTEDAEHPEEEEEVVKVTTDAKANTDKMQAQIEFLKTQLKSNLDGQSVAIDTRVALVMKAKEVLGDDVKTDGISNSAIQMAIVKEISPTMNLDGRSKDAIQAVYEMACEQHASHVDSSQDLLDITLNPNLDGRDEEDIDVIYADSIARIGSSSRLKTAKKEAS